jgi:branched-chain amino acid transport system ATP-binding protein
LLRVEDLCVNYGGIRALRGITLKVEEKSIVTLLGANGAGKSTTIRAVSGMVSISGGRILFLDRDLAGMPAHDIQRLGLVHVPEGRKIFANLTVKENLLMGAYNNRDKAGVERAMEAVFSRFAVLRSRMDQLGGTLSGGEQQMLAVGRALMSAPRLLMMDEPSLGLAPLVVAEVFRIIRDIRAEGVTLFLVEQNANAALKVADHAYVLETGRIVMNGPGGELLADPRVKEYYLGESTREESPRSA